MRTDNRNNLLLIAMIILLGLFFLIDLTYGSLHIPIKTVWQSLLGIEKQSIEHEIVINIRLPKAITAITVGVSLSIAGLVMQTLFRNPLADPYILGISSGASLGVAIVVMTTSILPTFLTGTWAMVLAAIIGATTVMLLIIAISYRVESAVSLLVVGIMLGTIAASIVSVIQYFSNPDTIKIFIMWHLGSLQAVSWQQLRIIVPIVFIGTISIFYLQQKLNALLLGEKYAQGLGINIRQTRLIIVISTSILAGSITAFTGPIAFIGIAVPHIAKGIFKTANHRVLLPACMLVGADLLLLCDIVSQLPLHPLPINTVSALFGAPIIIWIILKKR